MKYEVEIRKSIIFSIINFLDFPLISKFYMSHDHYVI